jgi:hypothetical protein
VKNQSNNVNSNRETLRETVLAVGRRFEVFQGGENHWKGLTEQQDRDASPTVANGIIKGAGYCECRIKRNAHNL